MSSVWCQLCAEENLVLMADEVYQTNVYIDDRPFLSFRKVRHLAIHHHLSPALHDPTLLELALS